MHWKGALLVSSCWLNPMEYWLPQMEVAVDVHSYGLLFTQLSLLLCEIECDVLKSCAVGPFIHSITAVAFGKRSNLYSDQEVD